MIKLILLCAFIAFLASALSQLVLRFVRGMNVSVTDAMAGKAVHVETPIGVFDLKPHEKLDQELAKMLVYPGATPVATQPPEYEAEGNLLGREFHVLVATFRTLTPTDVVWEFYRRELIDWKESRQRGRSLVQESEDGTRTIRVYGHDNSTLIETKVSLKPKARAAATSAAGASETRFGMLR